MTENAGAQKEAGAVVVGEVTDAIWVYHFERYDLPQFIDLAAKDEWIARDMLKMRSDTMSYSWRLVAKRLFHDSDWLQPNGQPFPKKADSLPLDMRSAIGNAGDHQTTTTTGNQGGGA